MSLDSSGDVYPKQKRCTRQHIFLYLLVAVLCLGFGILIGYFVGVKAQKDRHVSNRAGTAGESHQNSSNGQDDILQNIMNYIQTERIRQNLIEFTKRPRMSGTDGEKELADKLLKEWQEFGIDNVRQTPYDVLLSYPNKSHPNSVKLLSNTSKVLFTSAEFEKPLDEQGNNSEIIPPYNSYAAAGQVEGELVYVNYGRIEDFQLLVNNLSVSVEGKIVIARYGKIFRGDKVRNAERFNATGIIMYTDPSDFNMHGTNNTYPHTWWLPGTGVQRGTVGDDGDYLTPLYPSTYYAHRKKMGEIPTPKIPAQPVGYDDAFHFLRDMQGDRAPDDWQGKLPIQYRLGPRMKHNRTVRLTVNNYDVVRTVYNTIGYIRGTDEPDRYILLGNHHDTWVFGTIDPLSGTAAIHEIVRTLGHFNKNGVKPKRTIVFCTWGGEEEGLLGSTEWVEENMKVLQERAVAYLNVDYACDYHYVLVAGTSPLLQDPLYRAAMKVPNPDTKSPYKTVYDIWKHRTPQNTSRGQEPSVYYSLGSGSDMATFYQRAGVPSIDMWFTYDENKWDILSYPTYHSAYETLRMFESFIDPEYLYSTAMAKLWVTLAWQLANEEILSFDVRRYASAIVSFIKSLKEQFGEDWRKRNVNIEALESAGDNFTESTNKFHEKVSKLKDISVLQKRIINDKMIQLERAFIDPEGLPGRRQYKHVMFAPSMYDSYSDNSFPGIVDTMTDIQKNEEDKWDLLKQQIYVATYTIQSAANTLEDIGL